MTDRWAFCAIVEGRLRASVVDEDKATIALLDPRQASAGHTLVIAAVRSALIPVVALLLLLGACSKTMDNTQGEPDEVNATPRAEAEPTTAPQSAPTAKYHVFDNGVRCVVAPCASWTAKAEDGTELKITNVDLTGLGLPIQKEIEMGQMLMDGYMVSATVSPGPDGPGGKGTTLKISEVHQALKRPDRKN